MKYLQSKRKFICILFLIFTSLNMFSQGIRGSRHDFSSSGWNWPFMHGPNDEICLPCHTPHNADLAVADAPLWNHEVTVANFILYSSPTMDAVPNQPNGVSKLCLSCHDGTVALDSWGGQTGSVFWPPGHSDVMGTNLTDDHPISFIYDNTLAGIDAGLFNPAITSSGLGGTISTDLLQNNRLQCTSCHDVHDKYGNLHLLVKSNTTSALCVTCHNK